MPKERMTEAWVKDITVDGKRRVEYYDTEVKGASLVLQVSPSGAKVWYARYRVPNPKRKTDDDPKWVSEKMKLAAYDEKAYNLDKARCDTRLLIAEVLKGQNPAQHRRDEKNPKPDPEVFTFQQLWERYVTESALEESKDRTHDGYVVARTVMPTLKDLPVASITRKVLSDAYSDALVKARGRKNKEGKPIPLKGVCANRAMGVLKRVFDFAVDRGVVEDNPATGMKRRVPEPPRDPDYDNDQLRALWKAIEKEGALPQAAFKLRLYLGQRGGEIDAMEWSEVRRGVWTIPPAKHKKKREHKVALSRQALDILNALKPLTGAGRFVFPSDRAEEGHLCVGKQARLRLRRNSGIATLNPHDLRHVVVTRLLATPLSVPPHVASAVVGHVDRTMARATRIYDSNSYIEEKGAALQAWADLLDVILSKKPEADADNMLPFEAADAGA